MFNTQDFSDFSANDPNEWYIGATGDNKFVPMNYSKRASLQGKLYIKLGTAKWLILNALYQDRNYRDYDHNYKLNPDGDYSRFKKGFLGNISYTHVFSPSTFMDIKGSTFIDRKSVV